MDIGDIIKYLRPDAEFATEGDRITFWGGPGERPSDSEIAEAAIKADHFYTRIEKKKEILVEKDKRMSEGLIISVSSGNYTFKASENSLSKVNMALNNALLNDEGWSKEWKTRNDEYIIINYNDIILIHNALSSYIDNLFQNEKNLKKLIDDSNDPNDIDVGNDQYWASK